MSYSRNTRKKGGPNWGVIFSIVFMALLVCAIIGTIIYYFPGLIGNPQIQPTTVVNQPSSSSIPTLTATPTHTADASGNVTTSATNTPLPAPITVNEGLSDTEEDLGITDPPVLRCALANFPSYYTAIFVQQSFADAWDFKLELEPIGSGINGDVYSYSESEQAALLRNGDLDCLFTTVDTVGIQGEYGQLTLITDQSRGADFCVGKQPNMTINDMAGKRVAAAKDSISELLYIAALRVVGENPADPNVRKMVDGVETGADAVQKFVDGEADFACSWIPEMWNDGSIVFAPLGPDGEDVEIGHVVVTSVDLSVITDGLLFSNKAIAEKPNVVQAFHNAWYEAQKEMFDNPAFAAWEIVEWDRVNFEWTGLESYAIDFYGFDPNNPQTDESKEALELALADYFIGIPQAPLGAMQILMDNHVQKQDRSIVARYLEYTTSVWKAGGRQTKGFNPATIINPNFVLNVAAENPEFLAHEIPLFVEPPFVLHAPPAVKADELDLSQGSTIATLPNESFEFIPDSGQLLPDSLTKFNGYANGPLKTALEATSSEVIAVCTVGSAWPLHNPPYTYNDLIEFVITDRIEPMQQLMGSYGLPMNRVRFEPWAPNAKDLGQEEFEKHRNTDDPAIAAQDRFFRCEILTFIGR